MSKVSIPMRVVGTASMVWSRTVGRLESGTLILFGKRATVVRNVARKRDTVGRTRRRRGVAKKLRNLTTNRSRNGCAGAFTRVAWTSCVASVLSVLISGGVRVLGCLAATTTSGLSTRLRLLLLGRLLTTIGCFADSDRGGFRLNDHGHLGIELASFAYDEVASFAFDELASFTFDDLAIRTNTPGKVSVEALAVTQEGGGIDGIKGAIFVVPTSEDPFVLARGTSVSSKEAGGIDLLSTNMSREVGPLQGAEVAVLIRTWDLAVNIVHLMVSLSLLSERV